MDSEQHECRQKKTAKRNIEIYAMRDKVDFNHLISVFSYGGMPPELTERSMKLFASEVMPKLQNEGIPVTAGSSAGAQIAAK